VSGPQVVGTWLGALPLEIPFRIVLVISRSDSALSGTIDFPDQNARGLPLTTVRLEGDSLRFQLAPASIAFAGLVAASGDSILGIFSQGTQRFPLSLRRAAPEAIRELERPQEPKRPYPYREERVRIIADSGIVLVGTLTLPPQPGPRPAILLLAGAGPLDGDASVAGHRPFLVLADFLTRRGYAVLRYAKRGVPPSSGSFATATTADFARDAEAALRYLRGSAAVDGSRIVVVGHSEGALIAAMIAAHDPGLAGTVLIGAPGLRGDSLMLSRASTLLADRGLPDSLVKKDAAVRAAVLRAILASGNEATTRARTRAVLERELRQLTAAELSALGYTRENWDSGVEVYLAQLAWFRYWLPLDPIDLYERMHGPVLALYGSKDWQVPPVSNAERVSSALARHDGSSTVAVLPDVNHQMQTATTGSPAEYGRIRETISQTVSDRLEAWLTERVPSR
jgi:pimeloyl-ACP methyl ester carboxylesterase